MQIKKIVIIGPESTGKSTLSESLAQHYRTVWVKEYAREYLLQQEGKYKFEDLAVIARGQSAAEEKGIADADSYLFLDTDLYVIKVWSEFVFNKCDNSILTAIAKRKYDAYLLCNIDLPWVDDELREYPDLQTREKLFHYYKEIMVSQGVPWTIIGGNENERLDSAVRFIDNLNL